MNTPLNMTECLNAAAWVICRDTGRELNNPTMLEERETDYRHPQEEA